MDLRQLQTLLAVERHGSFSAAARAQHTVQSNVSAHIARLEQELDTILVDRSSGTLTEEGEVVAARARRIDSELEALAADVSSLHAEVSGSVRLGVIGTTARWLMPPLLETLTNRHPQVRAVVLDATTSSLLPQLETGRLDLAVVNLPLDDSELISETLFVEDTILLAPGGHPLADRSAVRLADLDGEPLLLEPEGTAFRSLLDAAAERHGITLRAQAEVDGMRLLASLAFQGFGATLVPASAAPRWVSGDWYRIPVADLDRRSVGLARRRRGLLSAPARALREVVREVVATEGPRQPGIEPQFA
ncbi:MAG: LysR family transcriptional regulator [Acidimicrobiia bacterium]|nr:LysR family transcriptional regulator [Acidimicrobiia bacterium]